MELHTFVGSPNSRKVEAVIDHLGLDVLWVLRDDAAGRDTLQWDDFRFRA